ncbi:MAG: hypothetical protein R2844_19725 [Caldilineales bacterium]
MGITEVLKFAVPKVRDTAIRGAAQLESLGIRHALAGGLAVGARGYVRATTHVDFLVGDEAFEHHGALVTFRPGVPIEVDGVRIDCRSPVALGEQLGEVLDNPLVSHGLAVVPAEALIYMKLRARRRQDLLDVVELINAGINVTRVRGYLEQYAADLVSLFDELADEALQS